MSGLTKEQIQTKNIGISIGLYFTNGQDRAKKFADWG